MKKLIAFNLMYFKKLAYATFLIAFMLFVAYVYNYHIAYFTTYSKLVNFVNNNNIYLIIAIYLTTIYAIHFATFNYQKYLIKRIPNYFNFSNSIQTKDGVKRIFDKVFKIKDGVIYIKNRTKVEVDNYINNKESIKHYLDLNYLRITEHKNNEIKLDTVDRLPISFNFDKSKLKENEVYFGINEDEKDIFVKLSNLTHLLISGTSGSGKSVFINLFLVNLFYNLNKINSIFLIDFKGGLTFSKFAKVSSKIRVAEDIEELYEIIKELDKINSERMKYLKDNELEKYEEDPIFFIFDEFADFMDRKPDKKEKELLEKWETINTLINSLGQIGRSQNIKLIIITQRPSSEVISTKLRSNLQSRIMLKVKDSETIRMILGDSEFIEELDINPKMFNYGRMIFLEDSSKGTVTHYLQAPFIKPDEYKSITIKEG